MGVGLKVLNDNSIYQIDENTVSMVVRQTGTLAQATPVTINSQDWSTTVREITYTGNSPLFGLYVPYQGWVGGTFATKRSGNTWKVQFAIERGIVYTPLPPAMDLSLVKYFVFDKPDPSLNSGIGMRVFKENSELAYSTDWKTKTFARNIESGKKYCGVGGGVYYQRDLDVEQWTDQSWHYHEWQSFEGFTCASGSPEYAKVIYYDESGEGIGGGGTSGTFVGVSQPTYMIDVTEYI